MKRIVTVWAMATILVLAGSPAWAVDGGTPTILIDDRGEGAPVVTATDFLPPQYLEQPFVQTASEFAHVTGTIYLSENLQLSPGNFGIKFLEFQGGPVSDFLTLAVSQQNTTNFSQTFEAIFWSDGANFFADALSTFNQAFPNAPSFVEDGMTPFGITYGGSLSVVAISDADAAPIPEPTTMLLLGTGLAGLAGLRRRSRK